MYYINSGANERQQQFIAETEADIAKLPTNAAAGNTVAAGGEAYQKAAFGSIALCVETGDIYVLTSNNQWTKVGG